MAIQTQDRCKHWDYFLSVERDLQIIARYVEFEEDNFDVYSIEIARLLLAACAEVDVVCKQLCRRLDNGSRAGSIEAYREGITKYLPDFGRFRAIAPRYGLQLRPWANWNTGKVPDWWTAYNKMKHHRHSHFAHGNLKNSINAVAGLYVVTLYLYREQAEAGVLRPAPSIFDVTERNVGGRVMRGDVKYVL